MALKVQTVQRVIRYQGRILEDFNPSLSVGDVMRLHAATEPALATAHIEGPTLEGDTQVYEVKPRVGNKG